MKRSQPDLKLYFELPNPGLLAYFEHTVQGNSDDYRPPFWKGETRQHVVDGWHAVVDELGVAQKYPSLYQFEMDMKAKIGPMSIQLPLADRIDSIEAYYTGVEGSPTPISQEAIQATVKFFSGIKGLRLRTRRNVAQNMRLSTNSGNPWFTKRRRVIDSALESTIIVEDGVVYGIVKGHRYKLAAILGWRGQEGGMSDDDVKQRVIWMMSLLLNLYELQVYQPAIAAVQAKGLIPAYVSMDAVDREVTQLFATKGADDLVYCTDFTKFDQHFNASMQDAARQILTSLLAPGADSNWWLENIFPIKFNLPLICSSTLMYEGPHGMGSGSGGTNFDECLAHKALQFEACLANGRTLNPHSMAYGDDGVLSAPGLTIEEVIRAYESHGMIMNPDKQYASKHDCVVLRRWHSVDYRNDEGIMVGVYSTFRALGRLLAQERFYDPEVWGPRQVTLRAWSIIENCNNSPYFEQFVQYVLKGDKFRLGLDLEGFMDNIDSIAKESVDQIPDFLGYTKTLQSKLSDRAFGVTGIKTWRIYKYLSSLR